MKTNHYLMRITQRKFIEDTEEDNFCITVENFLPL